MKNIDVFHEVSGLVFAKLYDAFPVRITINKTDIASELSDEAHKRGWTQIAEGAEERIRNRTPLTITGSTIEWLRDAGFLSYQSVADGNYEGIILTTKGLESLQQGSGLGSKLVNAAKDLVVAETKAVASEQLRTAVNAVLSWSAQNLPMLIRVTTDAMV